MEEPKADITEEMNIRRKDAVWVIENGIGSDLKIYFHRYTNHDNGWKLSIQGKDIHDSIHMFDHITPWLYKRKISHKIGTSKRYSVRDRNKHASDFEQSFKTLTIYCPNDIEITDLAKDVYQLLIDSDYRGWEDVQHPTSYTLFAEGLYYRNDRDEDGKYIRAMPK